MGKIINLQNHRKKKYEEGENSDVTFALCSCTPDPNKQGFLPVVRHSLTERPELIYLLCLNCEAELPVSGYLD